MVKPSQDPHRHRQAQPESGTEVAETLGEPADRYSVGERVDNSAPDQSGRQGHDQGVQVQADDQRPVDEAIERSGRDDDEQDDAIRQAEIHGAIGGENAGQPHAGADRKVELPHRKHEHRAEARDPDERHRPRFEGEAAHAQEIFVSEREQHAERDEDDGRGHFLVLEDASDDPWRRGRRPGTTGDRRRRHGHRGVSAVPAARRHGWHAS